MGYAATALHLNNSSNPLNFSEPQILRGIHNEKIFTDALRVFAYGRRAFRLLNTKLK